MREIAKKRRKGGADETYSVHSSGAAGLSRHMTLATRVCYESFAGVVGQTSMSLPSPSSRFDGKERELLPKWPNKASTTTQMRWSPPWGEICKW